MRRQILALAAALAIGAATMTTGAMAFRGGGMGMGGGAHWGGGGSHWAGGHHFDRFRRVDRDDFRFHRFSRFDRDDFRFRHRHRLFVFAGGPGFYGDSCYRPVWTRWGWRQIWVCD